jgi:uncharacterized SAM-binding protein YcdF (DUF218 family)
VAALVAVFATDALFISPRSEHPTRVDAVVVFGARSHEERLPAALRLIGAGVARVLVASAPPESLPCGQLQPFEIICVHPDPFTTRGEARAVASVARRRGWSDVAVTTSAYHVTRATKLLRRCFRGEVVPVSAPPPRWRDNVGAVLHEWGGLAYALVVERDC